MLVDFPRFQRIFIIWQGALAVRTWMDGVPYDAFEARGGIEMGNDGPGGMLNQGGGGGRVPAA